MPPHFQWSCPPRILLVVSLSGLFLKSWQFWGGLVRYFVKCPVVWGCLVFFFVVNRGSGFGEEDLRYKLPFSSHITCLPATWWVTLMVTWSPGWGTICQVCLWRYCLFHLFPCPTLWSKSLSGIKLSLHTLLRFLLYGRFVCSPLCIYLVIYIAIDSWIFILYFGL